MYAVEKVFLSLPLFRYDQPIWKTSPRVMHDYKRSHGQHFQQSRPQNLSMEWRCFESSFVTGVCWCHTCKRHPSWKLFWIHRWDSETDRSSDQHQRIVYNDYKLVHSLKFQSVALPNGLIGNMFGPVGMLVTYNMYIYITNCHWTVSASAFSPCLFHFPTKTEPTEGVGSSSK